MEKLFDFSLEPKLAGTESLYFRRIGEAITFDTYFNSISLSKISKYTDIENLSFRFDSEGECKSETIRENGIVYLKIIPESKDFRLNKVSVYVESKTVGRVNCAIIFCTYRREDYIKKNVNYLLEKLKRQEDFGYTVIVADNGRTLRASDFAKGTVLVGNINNGGSGGFKKGMEEAKRIGGFTHFILMDDDVEIDFAAIQKLLNFLRFLKPEYKKLAVSGSMLYKDKPTVQFEAGGNFGKDGIQKAFGHFLDLSERENLVLNERENDINYGGWWLMCMPFGCIEDGNFPMPFFLKYDDVEYALRCKLKIITMNGVGVWHEKFETKYNSDSEYYNTRNFLHLCRLYHIRINPEKWAGKRIRAKKRRQQYKMAEAVRRGYEDFLKGAEWLKGLDAEENHRRVCALNYEFLSYDEIERRFGIRPQDGKFYSPPRKKEILNPQRWLPKKYVFTDRYFDSPLQYIGAEMAVHCDSERNCGYVTENKN